MCRKTLFVFLNLLLLLPCCKSDDTITISQPLSMNDSLFSKQHNFELHFFSPGNSSNWYIGIRYAKLPEKPVVWVANRNNPINNATEAFFAIDGLGNLVLFANNVTDIPIWSTNISVQVGVGTSDISARLLDSGNLILVTNDDDNVNPLWQSFDYPTDTFLPGMKLGFNRRTGMKWSITSWRSENDPSTGDYSFGIDLSGSPQYFLYKGSTRIWRSNPWPWTDQPTTMSTYPSNLTYVNNKDEVYFTVSPNDPSKMQRLVVEKSGMLRLMLWNLNNGKQWDDFWAVPKYRCDSYAECGANSKCSPDNYSRFQCECLPGFEPKLPSEWWQKNASNGCVRKLDKQQLLTSCENGDEFVTVARVNRPDMSVGGLWWAASDVECESACVQNCSCTAFMSWGTDRGKIGCFMWYGELIDIVEFTSEGYDLKVRVNTKGKLARSPSSAKSSIENRQILAVIVMSIVSFLLLCFGFLHFWLRRKRSTSYSLEEKRNEPDLPLFHLSTVMAATDSFSLANRLGQGGFGSVYKGLLSDGRKIAVKRMSKSSGQGVEEFKTETMLIAKLQHRNLVKLLGCCIEREEKMLIYEYMPNKSLDTFIFDQTRRSCLDWKTRLEIIMGIARGVLYLHQDSRLRIIHRDLKASNVLLDSEMTPKISDFGMARTFTGDQIHDKTNRVVGTYGYMSPEYAVFGKFSTKSDVFSFGIVLLEIISGMRNNHCYLDENSTNLIAYVWQLWKEDRVLEIVDSLLKSYKASEVLRCIQIGLLCVQDEVKDRPTMSVVVLMLSSEITLPFPEKPAYMFMRSFEDSDSQIEEGKLCSSNQLTITEVLAR